MNVLAVGMSHRTATVRELERAAVSGQETGKLLAELMDCPNLNEVVLLSTCNRVEVYTVVDTFHGGLADVTGVLARHIGVDAAELSGSLYVHYSAAAVEHLFAVAAGLDSMVVGEAQILGQLRAAYATADEVGTVGRVLHELIQYALRVGKRVHSETDIDHVGASVVGEALADASSILSGTTSPRCAAPDGAPVDAAFAGLAGRRAVVVGAGAMGGLAAAALRRAGIGHVVVVNRTTANGQRLATSLAEAGVSARAAGLDALVGELGSADLVVACTGSNDVVVSADMVAVGTVGKGSPLVVCDLGLPRDVDPEVGALPGVTLVSLDTLRERLLNAPAGRAAKVGHQIVADEVRGYLAAQRSAAVTPTVTALRKRAAEVVDAELLRLDAKLPGLDPQVRSELSRTVRRVVDKLLHSPTVRVKQLASAPGGTSYADALRELFELDPQAAAIISSPKQEEK